MWVGRLWWPMLRVGGFILAAPVQRNRRTAAGEDRAVAVAGIPDGALGAGAGALSIFSGAGLLAAVQEMLIGVAIGMVVQLTFEALTFAGQTISMTMGLGFATLVDPQRGANTTVLGQMFMIFGILTYLAINGHLVLLGALAESFQTLPIGAAHIDKNFLLSVALWGARVFEIRNLDCAARRDRPGDRQSGARCGHARGAAAQSVRHRLHHHAVVRIFRAHRRSRRHHGGHLRAHQQRAAAVADLVRAPAAGVR
jgi:hypothetical protein